MKKYMQWVVVPALMLVLLAPAAGAQAYTTYQTPAQQQQIAYLYALVSQLQAQLNALLAAQGHSQGGTATNYIAITSESVSDASNNSVQMYGTANILKTGTARFWFEYGTTRALTYSTESRSVNNARAGSHVSFTFTAPDINTSGTYYYRAVGEGADGRYAEGVLKSFTYNNVGGHSSNDDDDDDNNNDDEPDVTTDNADDIDSDSAELAGSIDMNDFEDGTAFFVYGEDRSQVDDVTDEDSYSDIDTDGYDLRKVSLTTNLDGDDDFTRTVSGLRDDTRYYFRMCVQFENDDNDDQLVCGDVEDFDTDNN